MDAMSKNDQRLPNNRYQTLSVAQQKQFKAISGYEYDGHSLSGQFTTDRPEDADDWQYSPWQFSYAFYTATGHLVCSLEHRMTNTRQYGWDIDGNDLFPDFLASFFPQDDSSQPNPFNHWFDQNTSHDQFLQWERFIDKAKGALLGLALGDALGTTLEFKPKDSYELITDLVGGGIFHLQAGQWTDDTSMALCLADSLLAQQKHDGEAQLNRYVDWARNGVNSSTGQCFDIGNTIRSALNHFLKTGDVIANTSAENCAGNGSLMRLAPISIFYSPLKNVPLDTVLEKAKQSSETTHSNQVAIEACQIMAWLLYQIFDGEESKAALYNGLAKAFHSLSSEMSEVVQGSFLKKSRDEIFAFGYVVKSLEAALWCFAHSDNFEQGALLAANLGDDADTTAAIYGQLAGAFYGAEQLPQIWLDKLFIAHKIESVAEQLASMVSRGL